ncbi:Protein kri1 [Neolecta irregularis DAH-3]|uniref:Protein kri1 n=1 Tax=Neolecta irregularis (strain DAH-3) TaxID=1198029 RepID=A0A1U7LR77_NEOID|nr:Protein kri1 [Neolecta irregularis DAH-3]|eukprot:OLL25052.1 Protein kri1 [Neolecta irregularis DAH-3]
MPRKKSTAKKTIHAEEGNRKKLAEDLESDIGDVITINESYASKFEYNKKRDELSRLQEKYGGNAQDGSSSSSGEEDSDGELITPAVDAALFKTLKMIREKDPGIYKADKDFFKQTELDVKRNARKEKPIRLKDYHRQRLLDGDIDIDVEEEIQTHEMEQEELRRDVINAFHESDEVNDDDLLVPRKKSSLEKTEEEDSYKRFLAEHAGSIAPKDDNEKFLLDFLTNKAWIDKENKTVPSYDQIVSELIDEEEFDEKADIFETNYNFRFEQSTEITSHARDVPTVRRTDNKRKEKRKEVKERKVKEKKEDLSRFKKLKREEIKERLKKIAVGGGVSGITENDLEEEFDPAVWDKRMSGIFNDEYYDTREKMPKWDDDIDISDITKTNVQESSTQRPKKQKLDSFIDEKFNINYEDVVNGQATRFRYRECTPTTFGLTVDDILNATEKELNEYVGIKKYQPYRNEESRKRDKKKFGKKQRLREWRKSVEERLKMEKEM